MKTEKDNMVLFKNCKHCDLVQHGLSCLLGKDEFWNDEMCYSTDETKKTIPCAAFEQRSEDQKPLIQTQLTQTAELPVTEVQSTLDESSSELDNEEPETTSKQRRVRRK